jgi:hypothetical protein
LSQFLRSGFPLGTFPELDETIILKNSKKSEELPDLVWAYIRDKEARGRFTGPYSQAECERILRGHFMSSPLVIVTTVSATGEPKHRICRHLSKSDPVMKFPTVNEFIVKEDFPTHFGTAQGVADIVSNLPSGQCPVPRQCPRTVSEGQCPRSWQCPSFNVRAVPAY